MKRMKFYLLALTTLVTVSSFAQDKDKKGDKTMIGIGAEVAVPFGDMKESYKLGLGGSAKLHLPIFEGGQFTFNAGYVSFSAKEISYQVPTGFDPTTGQITYTTQTTKGKALNTIPIKAGLRYNVAPSFFLEPQLGYTSVSGGGGGAFTYAFNLGTVINDMIDISARYEAWSKSGATNNFAGVRIAYNFGL